MTILDAIVIVVVLLGCGLVIGLTFTAIGIQADMVVYGKTVAGGFPIGVVCGKSALMRRLDPEHPMRMAYVVGTFSAHPAVMATMNEFLRWVVDPATVTVYREANRACAEWARSINEYLTDAALPIRIANLATRIDADQ